MKNPFVQKVRGTFVQVNIILTGIMALLKGSDAEKYIPCCVLKFKFYLFILYFLRNFNFISS